MDHSLLSAALEKLGSHDHLCSIYESEQERFAAAAPFVRIGLERGERCLYVADEGTEPTVRQALQAAGIDVERALAAKSLVLLTKDQAYLTHGAFDRDRMFAFWKEAAASAMRDGFSALRAVGEAGWLRSTDVDPQLWTGYECQLNRLLDETNCSILCQYHRQIFPPDLILDVIRTHPTVIYRGTLCRNVYHVPPEESAASNQAERNAERLLTCLWDLAHATRVSTMRELAASIAHEMNQPLGAITNNANASLRLLIDAPGCPSEVREALTDILTDATRAGAIIKQVRALADKSPPETMSLQLTLVVIDALALVSRELRERRIAVQSSLPENLPHILGDRTALQQVLVNIMINAIDAMSGLEDDRRVLKVSAQRHQLEGEPVILIEVQDSGSGFKPEDSERLFEAFFTTKVHGMGIGLRISRSIVEAHGGRIWATANALTGATFSFALPVGAA